MDVADPLNEEVWAQKSESAVASATVSGGSPGTEMSVIRLETFDVVYQPSIGRARLEQLATRHYIEPVVVGGRNTLPRWSPGASHDLV